jgi:hypothetical protein
MCFRKSKSRVAYRWRSWAMIGLLIESFVVLMVVWIGLIVSFNLYSWVELDGKKVQQFYVNDRFERVFHGMKFGELVACVVGPLMIAVVSYEGVKQFVIFTVKGGFCRLFESCIWRYESQYIKQQE